MTFVTEHTAFVQCCPILFNKTLQLSDIPTLVQQADIQKQSKTLQDFGHARSAITPLGLVLLGRYFYTKRSVKRRPFDWWHIYWIQRNRLEIHNGPTRQRTAAKHKEITPAINTGRMPHTI